MKKQILFITLLACSIIGKAEKKDPASVRNTYYKNGIQYTQVDQNDVSIVTSLTFVKTPIGKCFKLYVSDVNIGSESYDINPDIFSAHLYDARHGLERPVEVIPSSKFIHMAKQRTTAKAIAAGALAVGMGAVAVNANTLGGLVAGSAASATATAVGTASTINDIEQRKCIWEQYLKRNTINPGEEIGGFVLIPYMPTYMLHVDYNIHGQTIHIDYEIPKKPLFLK